MTQAPTPGPLTSESVKLLVKGDLLLCADRIIRSVEQVDAERGVLWFTDGEACGPSVCVFIGRPDADGWMPWPGGKNPVGNYDVAEIQRRDGTQVIDASYKFDWLHSPRRSDPADIIAFRLAPTAPVEASGSEHIADELKPNDIAAILEENADADADGLHNASQLAQKIYYRMKDLRPQPSGETRPTDEELRSAIKATEYKYFGDYEFSEEQHAAVDVLVRAAQALLSARPLALGGQQGERADRYYEALVQADLKIRSLPGTDQSDVEFIRDALSTTLARAEAQDEGAAGEIKPCPFCGAGAQACKNDHDDPFWRVECDECPASLTSDRFNRETAIAVWNARAHPSPTPAADVQRLEAERDAWKLRGDNHWETLRSIREFAGEGDCERIIQWVNDAGSGHVESVEQTLGQMTDRAAAAEARADRLAEISSKLDAAISWLDYPFIDNRTPEAELRQRVGFMMKDAEPHRAALQQETQP